MPDTFAYRPKFVDIRVKKPAERDAPVPESKDRPCDHIGCKKPGGHRAPKSRERVNEYWHFCLEHVTDYNRRWNYFAGMTDGEFAEYQAREEVGHRPTWSFKSGKGDRLSAAMRGFQAGRRADPFGMFHSSGPDAAAPAPKQTRRLTRLQVWRWKRCRSTKTLIPPRSAPATPSRSNAGTRTQTAAIAGPRPSFSASSRPIRR